MAVVSRKRSITNGNPHLMGCSNARNRWKGLPFALMRKVPSWWDESEPLPTYFKIAR